MLSPIRSFTALLRVAVLFLIFNGILWVKQFPRTPFPGDEEAELDAEADGTNKDGKDTLGAPAAPAQQDQVVLSIKTGAIEAFDKLPGVLLLLHPEIYPNLLLYSDLDQGMGGFDLFDVLADYNETLKQTNPDFAVYHELRRYAELGQDVRELAAWPDPRPDWRTGGHGAGWALDKYKFCHMVEDAWRRRPARDWYVFAEPDTHLLRGNLLAWLGKMDPATPLYLGKPTGNPRAPEGETYPFAHGGSGFVLSRGLVEQLMSTGDWAARWDERAQDMWFGDYVLAAAIKEETGVELTNAWPLLSGLKPATMPFAKETWCAPVVGMHHVRPEEASEVWRFEIDQGDRGVTFKDLYQRFVAPAQLDATRADWDNGASAFDTRRYNIEWKTAEDGAEAEADADASESACVEACIRNEACMMWSWSNVTAPNFNANEETHCHLSQAFALGERRTPEVAGGRHGDRIRAWKSGWLRDRFESWAAQESENCNGILF